MELKPRMRPLCKELGVGASATPQRHSKGCTGVCGSGHGLEEGLGCPEVSLKGREVTVGKRGQRRLLGRPREVESGKVCGTVHPAGSQLLKALSISDMLCVLFFHLAFLNQTCKPCGWGRGLRLFCPLLCPQSLSTTGAQ